MSHHTIKALTIRQPWASLIMEGSKDIENRGWATRHRGALVIHAGKAPDKEGMAEHLSHADVPRGVILGVVDLVDVVQGHPSEWAIPGQYHWVLANPRALVRPLRYSGAQGLFEVPARLVAKVA